MGPREVVRISVTPAVRQLFFRCHGRLLSFRAAGLIWRFADTQLDGHTCNILRLPQDTVPDFDAETGTVRPVIR